LEYKPQPINTAHVALNSELARLGEVLAKNTHENWAKLRISDGWRYGPCRNDERKEHTNLVPYEQLSESEKNYDRQTALETVKSLLAMGYRIEAVPGARLAVKSQTARSEAELAGTLQKIKDSADVASMQSLWRGHDPEVWADSPETYRQFGHKMLRLGQPLLAYDAAAEACRFFPDDLQLRQLLALALGRSGAAGAANALLAELYAEGYRDEETLGLLARTHKHLAAEETDPIKARVHLRRALELYSHAHQTMGSYWGGINAATLALGLGEREQALHRARQVQQHCREQLARHSAEQADRYWLLSTLGEASLLLGEWSDAEDAYARAIELGRGDWGDLQSTRHNALLLLRHLGVDPCRIESLFRFPAVLVFAGHMVDTAHRATPRFPPQLEPALKDALRSCLRRLNAGFGFASIACGSDILFHECLLEMNAESHVVLPYERELFLRDSVNITPVGNWGERCQRILAQACEVQEVSTQSHMRTAVEYEFANLMLHGLARVRAQQLETNFVPLAVWDGKPGSRMGGTSHTVERWRKLGLQVEIIPLEKLLRQNLPELYTQAQASSAGSPDEIREEEQEFESEIRALLFADVEHFSSLTDQEIPRFVRYFLGQVGKLAAESPHRPLARNTWGDGLYFVFANAHDAGRFALDLRDLVRDADWSQQHLPPLNLRIGLHAGPVFCCSDPVTLRTNYLGAHVSRAARIEPITPPGQVYASQAFVALSAAEGVEQFRCDYVGQTPMAKKYGTFPTYVVLRRSSASAT